MRTRLLLVLSLLGTVMVALFAIPLATSVAQSRTSEFVLSRNADLERFVALAGPYVRGEESGTLFGELDTYRSLYDEPVGVVSTRGAATYPADLPHASPQISSAVTRALRNQQDGFTGPLSPWGPDRVVFARATGTDAQITGAVVLLADTRAAREHIAAMWLAIAGGALAALAALLGVALAVSTWVLRPLARLSTGMRELVSALPRGPDRGDHQRPIAARSGPPELRDLSHTFALMAGQVRRSAESQQRLIADTAHQLRNPLAALQLRLDALDGRVDPAAQSGYQRAVDEAERLAGILDDLLDLSRAEVPAGIGGPEAPSCRPAAIAADRVAAWQGTAERAGVRLLAPDEDDSNAVARFEAGDLAQVLDALLDNACKYAGAGAEVVITATEWPVTEHDTGIVGPVVWLSCADTGLGVPGGEPARLRERFYRGDRTGGSRGSGLGLSIAEALVTSGGGSFGLEATDGEGLTAVLALPAGPAEGTDPFAPPTAGRADIDDHERGERS